MPIRVAPTSLSSTGTEQARYFLNYLNLNLNRCEFIGMRRGGSCLRRLEYLMAHGGVGTRHGAHEWQRRNWIGVVGRMPDNRPRFTASTCQIANPQDTGGARGRSRQSSIKESSNRRNITQNDQYIGHETERSGKTCNAS